MLRKTLYHEMGHINDMMFMPKLYNCVLVDFENRNVNADSISALFWLEYLAEKRTAFFENVYNLEICDEFVKRKWHCSVSKLSIAPYLSKISPTTLFKKSCNSWLYEQYICINQFTSYSLNFVIQIVSSIAHPTDAFSP